MDYTDEAIFEFAYRMALEHKVVAMQSDALKDGMKSPAP